MSREPGTPEEWAERAVQLIEQSSPDKLNALTQWLFKKGGKHEILARLLIGDIDKRTADILMDRLNRDKPVR